MSYWFNIRTGEVASSEVPVWDSSERLGPFNTEAEAKNAYLVAQARNIEADLRVAAEREDAEDSFDREDRQWKQEWDN